jgi:apolipoprotein N-acyltransferase
LWNSLLALDSQGRITGSYDKFHLVPFGEYVPLRGFLPINKLTAGRQDFSPGPGLRTIKFDGLPPVSPLICYEVIFPGRVAAMERPAWLLNLTNDAWFGQTSGPYQHFAAARLRSVEEGLPLVRVANTGISGVVDGYGRIVHSLGLGREGVIDSALPAALSVRTPFSRLGDGMTGFLLVLTFGAGLMMRRIVYNFG